jgi:hemolysin III
MLASPTDRMDDSSDSSDGIEVIVEVKEAKAPIQADQEWANALTHGIAALLSLVGAGVMIWHTSKDSFGTTLSCLAFVLSASGVFIASTFSHFFLDDPIRLKRLRAWDQGLIYTMISGTYTPLIFHFADARVRDLALVAIWVAAAIGFYSKVFANHRVNGIGTATYLALGWLPALVLIGRVPTPVLVGMSLGGIIYTMGVAVLMNDSRVRYMHALWHLLVMSAASCHYWTIFYFVAGAAPAAH